MELEVEFDISTDSDDVQDTAQTIPSPMSPKEFLVTQNDHADKILQELNENRKNSAFCDVTILVDNQPFPAHRAILSAYSPYFKAMFTSSLLESRQDEITLRGIDAVTFGSLLDFAYTSKIVITKLNVQSILAGSNLLQILSVKEATCQYLQKHMDITNCLGIHCFAEMHNCCNLQRKAKLFILDNFYKVCRCEEFLNVPTSTLIDFAKNDKLHVKKEQQLFEAILRWYNYKPDERKKDFPLVLSTVRMAFLSPYYIIDNIACLPIVKESEECQTIVEDAKLYHLLPDRRHSASPSKTRPRQTSEYVNVIITVGGEDDKVVLRTVECLDPTTMDWKSFQGLPFAISKHGLVADGNNKMYHVGGEFPDGGSSHAVWRYDPALDTWIELKRMQKSRSELGVAVLDGFLYALGGWDGKYRLNCAERYDPSTNTWSNIACMSMAATSVAAIAHNKYIYVTGGAVMEEGDGIDTVMRYDPRTNTWKELAPMKIPRSGAAICCIGDYLYVVGGWHASTENTNRVERYDVKNNKWEVRQSMLEKRYRPGVAVMDGKIYVLGGEEGWDRYHASIERYDPESDTWEIIGEMMSKRSWLGCVSLQVSKSICNLYQS